MAGVTICPLGLQARLTLQAGCEVWGKGFKGIASSVVLGWVNPPPSNGYYKGQFVGILRPC